MGENVNTGDIYFKFTGRDTFKAVKQYIHNGLGLSREDIVKEIREKAEDYAWKSIQDFQISSAMEDAIEDAVGKAVKKGIERLLSKGSYGYDTTASMAQIIEKAINNEVKTQVSAIIKDRISVMFKEQAVVDQ